MAQKKVNSKKSLNLEVQQKRMKEILRRLHGDYPDAECSLFFKSPFQLLIATILSAQCTDDRVNQVTPALFDRFPGPKEMGRASLAELEELIRTTGFYKNKAKSIQECSKTLVEKHGGKVPKNLEELTHLRGVGRKTANVVLGVAFGVPGLVVDTHVGRISRRMGFTRHQDPVKVEHQMMEIVPREEWVQYAHVLIRHGRAVCTARKAKCDECSIANLCEKRGVE